MVWQPFIFHRTGLTLSGLTRDAIVVAIIVVVVVVVSSDVAVEASVIILLTLAVATLYLIPPLNVRRSTSHRPTPTALRRPSGVSQSLSSRLRPPTTLRCHLPPLLIIKFSPPMQLTIVVPRRPHLWTRTMSLRGDASLPMPSSVIIVLPSAPPRPSVDTSHTLPPLLIVKRPSILTSSSHLTPPLFCLYTPRSPHIVCVTQFTIKRCVGWCVVITNPMDCTQIEHRCRRPWCADDACAWLGRPNATGDGMGQSRSTPWLTSNMSIICSHEGVLDLV